MHSRVFQIATEPIRKADRMTSDSLPDWFTEGIADYVSDHCDRKEDIEWFIKGVGFQPGIVECGEMLGSFTICQGGIKEFFTPKYKRFLEVLQELSKISLEGFCAAKGQESGDLSTGMFSLKEAVDDPFSFYIFDGNNDLYRKSQRESPLRKLWDESLLHCKAVTIQRYVEIQKMR